MRAGTSGDWTRQEVEAIVADYVAMLALELRGQPYSKTDHRRALSPLLDGRSDGSIERKHQNISAILIALGYPYIFGYKPLANYQALLWDVVADRVGGDVALAQTVAAAVEQPAHVPAVADWLARLEDAPRREGFTYVAAERHHEAPTARVNYLEREARNASLGRAGEEFVVQFERARLIHLDRGSLADRVEHVSVIRGDGLGFDVRSFEADGRDRLIEVKTTAYGKVTPFFVSKNEVTISTRRADCYHLYRVFRFRTDARLYTLSGPLDRVCSLEPVQFEARVM